MNLRKVTQEQIEENLRRSLEALLRGPEAFNEEYISSRARATHLQRALKRWLARPASAPGRGHSARRCGGQTRRDRHKQSDLFCRRGECRRILPDELLYA